eukprot:scaffold21808_cov123-Isochrysis_galbana.AAC.6
MRVKQLELQPVPPSARRDGLRAVEPYRVPREELPPGWDLEPSRAVGGAADGPRSPGSLERGVLSGGVALDNELRHVAARSEELWQHRLRELIAEQEHATHAASTRLEMLLQERPRVRALRLQVESEALTLVGRRSRGRRVEQVERRALDLRVPLKKRAHRAAAPVRVGKDDEKGGSNAG